ncbi:MAG TPA: DNA repair protein RecN [Prolixibacteraceae bacterium]|nr:DNA repair protein RecN [Prolixibacteraceae bacterium]
MLKSLSIKNYALIDSLSIGFCEDLNILTGETGAGKSILLGAIGLLIGQRADLSVLRDKMKKCTVEGVFEVSNYNLEGFFAENELDYDEVSILRREITPQGKSRAFINDTPVNVKVLHDLGMKLIDIHSQHQNLELNEKHYQLSLVDLVARNEDLLKKYNSSYKKYLSLQENLNQTYILSAQSKKDLDYYLFQYKQLSEAKLAEHEQEDMERLLEKLTHAGEIKSIFGQINLALDEDERSVIAVIKENLHNLGKLKQVFPEAAQLFDRLESVYIELKDIASESATIAEKTENDPDKVEQISQRLDLIYSLQQKHRVTTIGELLQIQAELNAKIQQVSSYDTEIEKIQLEIEVLLKILHDLADELFKNRQSVAPVIENKVIDVLRNLAIPNAAFKLKIDRLPQFTPAGLEEVSFMFSANKSQDLQEIAKVASGGEMSRLMLAIKTLITDTKSLPTIIFDEIDTGVSGEAALKMATIISQMAKTMQVLNITHLPQIAAKGKHHYKVYKFDQDEQTFTSIRKLTDDERVEEIAQMLSGEKYSQTSVAAAKELLE